MVKNIILKSMKDKKQTAVKWLVSILNKEGFAQVLTDKEIEQAIAMEKEQIIDAFGVGCQVESTRLIGYQGMSEQYYKENYGK